MADLTAAEASTRLKASVSEWWQAYIAKNYDRAAFLANDITAYARALQRATFKTLEEKKGDSNTPPAGVGSHSSR